MSTTIKKVAIAGATGHLGSVVTEELLKAGFELTALTRDTVKAKLPAGVKAVSADYDSLKSLTDALRGQDALVSTMGHHGIDQQELLIDAAFETGVKHIIPSEFGSDHTTSQARALPAYKDKVDIEAYLQKKSARSSTAYTIVTNNAFLDWGIEYGFLVNVKEKKARIVDGGDIPIAVTPLYQIGQAVAGVLKHPKETANREIKVQGAAISLNQLVHLVQEYSTKDGWQYEQWNSIEKTKEAYAALKADPSNYMAWGYPMIFRAAFGKGMLVDFSGKNDNALVGVKPLSEEELRHIVKTSVAKVFPAK